MPVRKKKPAPPVAERPAAAAPSPAMVLRCTDCGCAHFMTLEEIPLAAGRVRRLRACRHCGKESTAILNAAP